MVLNVKIGKMESEPIAQAGEESETRLGLQVVDIGAPETKQFNIIAKKGVVVVSVESDSPAEEAGIQIGDVIIGVGDEDIVDIKDFYQALKNLKKDKPVVFQIQRAERKRYVALTP